MGYMVSQVYLTLSKFRTGKFDFIYTIHHCSLYKKSYQYDCPVHKRVNFLAEDRVMSVLYWRPPLHWKYLIFQSLNTTSYEHPVLVLRILPATDPLPRALDSAGLHIPSALVFHLTWLAELEGTYSEKFHSKARLWDKRCYHGLKGRRLWITASHGSWDSAGTIVLKL